MRLTSVERKALAHALQGVEADAYVYGSRADPSGRGGDIDVLVLSRAPSPYRLSKEIAVRFRMECDEKIDVMVIDPDHVPPEQEPFVRLIRKEAEPV